ncbi:MAG: RES domain-containing protein [Methyloprofundus sp.]|nr:RES domain-containing protein [Methyloprofundus sp.]
MTINHISDIKNSGLSRTIALVEQIMGGTQYTNSLDGIGRLLNDLTASHPFVRYSMAGNFQVYRGRIHEDDHFYLNISELSYRKPEDTKGYGRCHSPGQSVFYSSNNRDTVFSELTPEMGNYVTIVTANPKEKKELYLMQIGAIDDARRYGLSFTDLSLSDSDKEIKKIFDKLNSSSPQDKEDSLKTIFLDAFMADMFMSPASKQRDYKVTAVLSSIICSRFSPEMGGLIYPSVAHRGGFNYAFNSEQFDQKMEICKCEKFELTRYLGFGIYERKLVAKSDEIKGDGEISWIETR